MGGLGGFEIAQSVSLSEAMTTTEQKREYQKRYREKYPDRIKAAKQKSRTKHRAANLARRKAAYAGKAAALKAAKKKWADENPMVVAMQRVRRRIKAMNSSLDNSLRFHHGVTLAAYQEVFMEQGGVCAICRKFEVTARVNRLVVDHDHATGQLRALLCHRCNCGIGYFKDDVALIARALAYLTGFHADIGEDDWASRVRRVLGVVPEEGGQAVRPEMLAAANQDGAGDGPRGNRPAPSQMAIRRTRATVHSRLLVVD